jgi:hypothetical protein
MEEALADEARQLHWRAPDPSLSVHVAAAARFEDWRRSS